MLLHRTYRQIAKQPFSTMARSDSEIHSRGQSGGVINIVRADISRAEYPHAFDSGVVPSKESRTHYQNQCVTRDKAQGYFHLQISLEFCLKACLWPECLGSFSFRNLLSLGSTGLERRGGTFTASFPPPAETHSLRRSAAVRSGSRPGPRLGRGLLLCCLNPRQRAFGQNPISAIHRKSLASFFVTR